MAVPYVDLYLLEDDWQNIAVAVLEMEEGDYYTLKVKTKSIKTGNTVVNAEYLFLQSGDLYKLCKKMENLSESQIIKELRERELC